MARPAIHPKSECRAALVREPRVAASAAGHCRGRVGFTRDQNERIVFSHGRDVVLNVRPSPNHRKTARIFYWPTTVVLVLA